MLPQQYMARSIATVSSTQVAATKMYQVEAIRLSDKLGANNPKAAALAAQAYAGAQTARVMAIQAEAATITPPTAGATTAAVSVRLVNAKGQGLEGYTIGLLRANGTLVETLGRSGASGFFATTYDEAKTAALAREGNLLVQVTDAAGKEIIRAKDTIKIDPGADVSTTLIVPVPVVPRSVAVAGTVISINQPQPPPAPPSRPPPAPPSRPPPAPPTPPPPPAPPSPPSPPAPPSPPRTSLDKLGLDAATRKLLDAGGIRDVEGILETDPAKLAAIIGDRALAAKLVEMANQLLNPQRTSLDKLGLDAATRKRLDGAGIKDVEGLLATDPAKLGEIVGDRTAATKLIDAAKKLLSTPARPTFVAAPETAQANVAKKKTAKKKTKR